MKFESEFDDAHLVLNEMLQPNVNVFLHLLYSVDAGISKHYDVVNLLLCPW